jgi:hypothetical protein
MRGATIKPPGEILNPCWKVSCRAGTVSTRFIPVVKDLAVFKEAAGKPLVIFRTIALPTDEELVPTAVRSSIEDAFNFVFLEAVRCDDWSWFGMLVVSLAM